ncbi:hypothetical protein PDE_06553 [Penicillium oxalicum 114-2]|uniref:Uncharacterized protein n=1 Tax=Penicillium oxalicum (strain 114-2 / CGMCC 5302) TaxID=933388 RepID=S8AYV1_PENO1|nr:hypothetical protein PDE_06553 [Penicillium oxalicum 114-2]
MTLTEAPLWLIDSLGLFFIPHGYTSLSLRRALCPIENIVSTPDKQTRLRALMPIYCFRLPSSLVISKSNLQQRRRLALHELGSVQYLSIPLSHAISSQATVSLLETPIHIKPQG